MSKKIILLAGPTASGKSKLAIHLAKKLKGEIINADSMQMYKEFSILSSRPNKLEIKKTIKFAEKLMKKNGRILVRKSGTESKIRVMGESLNKKLLNQCVDIISKKIK